MSEFQAWSSSHQTIRAARDWNALLDHGLEKSASYIIRKNGSYYEAINGSTGKIDYGGENNRGGVSGSDASSVIQHAINASSVSDVLIFKGNIALTDEIDITKALTLICYGAVFNWTGSTDAEKSMFKNSSEVDGFKWFGGKILSNHYNVFPFRELQLKNSVIADVTVNHTIMSTSLNNVWFRNVIQLGEQGAVGHDFGINIVGNNVTIDGFYAMPLSSEYQGGFVINWVESQEGYDNIVLRNIYVKGKFGSFVHWYIPKSDAQKIGGRVLIEDFYVEYTGVPKWGNFATFALLDTEGTTGSYSGDFGKITIRNGKILGPGGYTMVGSENSIGVVSLLDMDVANSNADADVTVDNVEISDFRRFSDYDVMTVNFMNGRLTLRDILYEADWGVKIADAFRNIELLMKDSKINVGSGYIKIESAAAGSSKIFLQNNFLSNDLTVYENSGHSMILDFKGNSDDIIIGAGQPQYYRNGGEFTFSADGVHDYVAVPHHLVSVPVKYYATAKSLDARVAQIRGVDCDADNLTVYFVNAPVSGVDNVTISWFGEVAYR